MRHEQIGDEQKQHARAKKQATVEQRQAPSHRHRENRTRPITERILTGSRRADNSGITRFPRRHHPPAITLGMLKSAAAIGAPILAAVAIAACGGSGSPSVAHLGSGTTSASSGPDSAGITQQQEVASYIAYAACLNRHGVEVQAARTGGLVWEAAPGIPGPRSPQAAAAEHDCRSLVPRGWGQPPTAAQTAENLALMLRLAKCMRAHGVPKLPDPTSQGLRISPSSGIDPNSPTFRAAEKSCQKDSLTLGGGP
jgi:hypothetical protein